MFGIGRAIKRAIQEGRAKRPSPPSAAALPTPASDIRIAPQPSSKISLSAALKRISDRRLEIGTVIDVGASNGIWSGQCEKFWPNARYHLVEAQPVHEEGLMKFCAVRPNASYVLKAAGAFEGDIFFDDRQPLGGFASVEKSGAAITPVKQTTIDAEIARLKLPGPYLIKLDTHGYEVPIFEGATEALKDANLVVVETYFFKNGDRLLMHEMIEFMAKRGFAVTDICDPLWREYDNSLWQIDVFFIRADRPEFSTGRYS